MYRLKKGQESFTPVDGPLAGRSFAPGKLYAEIPPDEARRFEKVKEQTAVTEKPVKTDSKKAGSAQPSETGEVTS